MMVSYNGAALGLPSSREIVIGGEAVPCAADVIHWSDSGLEVKRWQGSRPRRMDIDLMVLHWTGGEGDAFRVARTLRDRRLGVEFIIDGEGVVFQCCDPVELDTFDVGKYNRRSLGVEIVSYGFRDTDDTPRRGRDRKTYVTQLRGRRRFFASFRQQQTCAMVALCDAVCTGLDIPRRVPREQDGSHADRTLHPRELEDYSGVVGHYHLSGHKSDPGTEPFRVLEGFGYD